MRALELEKELKKGIAPGYIITGDDEYLERFVKESLLATIPKEERMFSYIPMDLTGANRADVGSVISAAETYTMMLGGSLSKKMIDVQPFDSQFSKNDEKILKEYFENPSEDSFILFEGATKAEDFLLDLCTEINCSKCNDTELYIFIDKKRAALKYKMESQTIKELIKLCSNDFGRIMTELDKLFMFAYDSKEITSEMLTLLVPPNMDMQVYELTNAISSGKSSEAINILNALKKRGEKPSTLLSMIASTYRRIFQIAISTTSDETIINALKISNGALFMNRKIVTQNRSKDPKYITKMKDAIKYLSKLEFMDRTYVVTSEKALDLAMSYLISMQGANGSK